MCMRWIVDRLDHDWARIELVGVPGVGQGAREGTMREFEGGDEKMPSLRYSTLYNTTDL